MGLLDPLFQAVDEFVQFLDDLNDTFTNPEFDGQQASEIFAQIIEQASPADEIGAVLVDTVEEFVVSELSGAGELTPENVESVVDETEGASTAVLLGLAGAAFAIELVTAGQVDKQTDIITQALAGLGIADATGNELDARLQEGVMPALEAKAGKEHRSKFVDVSDAVEFLLRNKTGDALWLQSRNIPTDAYGKVASNNAVNEQNALEEWGIRDDQLDILEEVALNSMEFEELIETPAELGLVVPDDVLDDELDRAGYSEQTKDFLRQVNGQIPKSARAYQELLVTEELIGSLDTLVKSGELAPSEAVDRVPDDVPVDEGELRDRYDLLADIPPGSPSATDLEGAFARGYLSRQEFERQLSDLDYPTDEHPGVLRATILDELDGDLQESVALGLVDETTFSDLCSFVGLDQETTDELLKGKSLADITKARLQEQTSPGERSVGAIQGIGESRSTSLGAIGIETLADLGQANAEEVAQATNVSQETAQRWISLAQLTSG